MSVAMCMPAQSPIDCGILYTTTLFKSMRNRQSSLETIVKRGTRQPMTRCDLVRPASAVIACKPAAIHSATLLCSCRGKRLFRVQCRSFSIEGTMFSNLESLEPAAKLYLSEATYGYFAGGSETETSLRENREALDRYRLLPRVLVDVSDIDTSWTFGCHTYKHPIIIAPMAMQRMCHPEGEMAMARAATALNTAMALSTMSTTSLEDVASLKSSMLWFQLYVLSRRDVTEGLIKDAEALGYKALVITVDAPRLGKREADDRNRFNLDPGLSLKMAERISAAAGVTYLSGESTSGSLFGSHFTSLIDSSLTWDFIPWVRTVTSLPIIVKGILAPDDARRAVDYGADAVVISNHGGRQLDFSPAGVDMLPHIAVAVGGRIPLIVDGSITRGTDVIKCLALGADAVMIGRPFLWALALGGQAGVEAVLNEIHDQLELSMALLGCRQLSEITSDFLLSPAFHRYTIPSSRLSL